MIRRLYELALIMMMVFPTFEVPWEYLLIFWVADAG